MLIEKRLWKRWFLEITLPPGNRFSFAVENIPSARDLTRALDEDDE